MKILVQVCPDCERVLSEWQYGIHKKWNIDCPTCNCSIKFFYALKVSLNELRMKLIPQIWYCKIGS